MSILYSNDFTGSGEPPANWTEEFKSATTATFTDIGSNGQIYVSNGAATLASLYSYDLGSSWDNISFSFKYLSNSNSPNVVFGVRNSGTGTGYFFRHPITSSVVIDLGSSITAIQNDAFAISPNDIIKIEVYGSDAANTIKIYQNNILKFNGRVVGSFINSGSILLGLYGADSGIKSWDLTDILVETYSGGISSFPQTSLSKVAFYKRSFCDKDVEGYNITGSFNNTENALDRNKNTFSKTGSSTDGTPVSFSINFDNPQTIDAIFLESNASIINFIDYYNGSSFVNFSPAITGVSGIQENFLKFEFNQITDCEAVRINITATKTPDSAKEISRVYVTRKITDMHIPEGTEAVAISRRENFSNIKGGSVQVIKFPEEPKVIITSDLSEWNDQNSGSNYTAYKALKAASLKDSYLMYPYLDSDNELLSLDCLYLVNDTKDSEHTPSLKNIQSGITGNMEWSEV